MENTYLLCSSCFSNQGLKISAKKLGVRNRLVCNNCKRANGAKLDKDSLETLTHQFFVMGSIFKGDYGAAPRIQFNEIQQTSIICDDDINKDIKLIEKYLDIGFFHYGPRLWTLGCITYLEDLQDENKRMKVIEDIISKYPEVELNYKTTFYRLRVNPSVPNDVEQYDSSPYPGKGRLDTKGFKVFYASQDLEVCIHECRVSITDELYVATLRPSNVLKMLDLSANIIEGGTEFESLNITILMLFYAGENSYEILRLLSVEVHKKGFDGIIFPSFFTQARLGKLPFSTAYESLNSHIEDFKQIEASGKIPNIAIFGSPVAEQKVEIFSLNKLLLNRVVYDYFFGPVTID